MGRVKITIAIVILVMIIGAYTVHDSSNSTDIKNRLEEMKKQTITVKGLRQDEVEEILVEFASMIYAPTSEKDMMEASESIKDILTEEEYNNILNGLYYEESNNRIQELKVYYCNKENSADGRAREYVDIKVGNNKENKMYLLEFTINSDGKIFQHKVWRY